MTGTPLAQPPGYFFEALAVGRVLMTGGMTVTQSAIIDFGREWDPQPFHIDLEASENSVFGGLIASGLHTLNIAYRLFCDSSMLRGTVVAGLCVGPTRFLEPVFAGTTLRVRVRVAEKTDAPQKGRGRVKVTLEAMTPADEVVMTSSLDVLVATRGA